MSKKGTFKEKIKENTQPRVNTILSQMVYDVEQDTERELLVFMQKDS